MLTRGAGLRVQRELTPLCRSCVLGFSASKDVAGAALKVVPRFGLDSQPPAGAGEKPSARCAVAVELRRPAAPPVVVQLASVSSRLWSSPRRACETAVMEGPHAQLRAGGRCLVQHAADAKAGAFAGGAHVPVSGSSSVPATTRLAGGRAELG